MRIQTSTTQFDNKTSNDVETFVSTEQTCIQYTPLGIHHTNPAKQAIRTWKNHFLASMTGLPKLFPIANWFHLLTKRNTTLNMPPLRCQNPLLLAHKALEGSFSFDATPMAPLGTEVLVHMKPNCQCTWGYHASVVLIACRADTGGKRITKTFQFKHHAIPVPEIMATDRIVDATERLTTTIAGI
jgi:hypothetical protein